MPFLGVAVCCVLHVQLQVLNAKGSILAKYVPSKTPDGYVTQLRVNVEDVNLPVINILYNGINHYDALLRKYCTCRLTYAAGMHNGSMIQCASERCLHGNWFHEKCLHISGAAFKALQKKKSWFCAGCKK